MRAVRKKGMMAGVMAAALVMGSLTLPENVSVFDFGAVFAQAAETVKSGTCGDNLTWTLDEDGALTISGTGNMDRNGSLLLWGEDITSVVIEAGLTSVGTGAFEDCVNLTSVKIPDSVTIIEASAFSGCENLPSIDIPDSVTTIEQSAFSNCESLKNIEIPDSVTSIGMDAFFGCKGLADENGFVIVRDVLYSYYGDETEIVIPDGVSVIDQNAFNYIDSSRIVSVKIPDGATYIYWNAFEGFTSMTTVDMPDSITEIQYRAFCGCTSLESVRIPSGMTNISTMTFMGCTSLKSVEIPKNITGIGQGAFADCTSLTDVYYEGTEEEWNAIDMSGANSYLTSATIHFNCSRATYEYGDANLDGSVDYLDAMTVLRADAELVELTDDQLSVADVNGDGAVDSLDAILILRYDAGLVEGFAD